MRHAAGHWLLVLCLAVCFVRETLQVTYTCPEGEGWDPLGLWMGEPTQECQPCPAGRFAAQRCWIFDCNTMVPLCPECESGKYTDRTFQTDCQPCSCNSDGEEKDTRYPCGGTQAQVCKSCTPGKYKNSDVGVCTACPPNTHSSNYRAFTCTPWTTCQAGQYVHATPTDNNDRYCRTCNPGKFSTNQNQADCNDITLCTQGQRTITAATSSQNTVCQACGAGDWTTRTGQETSCDSCIAGKYKLNGRCISCSCAGGQYYINCPVGSINVGCLACFGGDQSASKCAIGREPAVRCDGSQVEDPGCADCPAGKQKPSSETRYCEACPTGTYKGAPSTADCGACTNKAAGLVSVYNAWAAGVSRTTNVCPWTCVAGYYKSGSTCASCAASAGTYSSAGVSSCSSCTNKPATNSYYQLPAASGGFQATSDACPWECNAGYDKAGSSCVACAAGSYRVLPAQLRENAAVTPCGPCTTCQSGVNYETTACSATQNRVCSTCRASCGAGNYIKTACTVTSNTVCEACTSRCPTNKYLSGDTCGGNTNNDVVLARCLSCLTEADCQPTMTYLSHVCDGTTSVKNSCQGCTPKQCGFGFYSGGCGGLSDTRCLPHRVCPSGQYLRGSSSLTDGVCENCTSCTALGLVTVMECSRYADAVCGGDICGAGKPCGGPSRRFCDYASMPSAPSCGSCPDGYSTDGYLCKECPEGATCNQAGAVVCQGQCAAGIQSACNEVLGYAQCEQACASPTEVLGAAAPWRGSYAQSASCTPYFRCSVGWVKRFHRKGTVECMPCTNPPALAKYVTAGLSPNDVGSCLWECDYGLQYSIVWNGAKCVYVGTLAAPPLHAAGWYGGSAGTWTCGGEFTSEANTTLVRAGCLGCPPLIEPARRAADAVECEWVCPGGWTARGSRCVREFGEEWLCTDAGTTRNDEGKCVRSSVPWNLAGTGKVSPGVAILYEARGQAVNRTVAGSSLAWGLTGRHTVLIQGGTGQTLQTEGPLCSTTQAWIDGYHYLFAAVCNESFVAYLNLSKAWPGAAGGSAGVGRLEVLIGQADSPGWADGFRTQARFQTELHVASEGGGANGTVWVLDRWNCVVREITVWPRPGDYRTRVYTVHGLTERFLLVGQPKCYGAGSLAGPRRFWETGGGVALFTDEHGLWQLTLADGALASVMDEGWTFDFEADDLLTVELSTNSYGLRLGFRDGRVWTMVAKTEACPQDRTSMEGGDCTVQCEWLEGQGSYVNQTSGACVKCVAVTGCGVGAEPVVCTRDAPGRCRPCPPVGAGRMYVESGQCERWVYLAPCPVGFWGLGVCTSCPPFTTTVLAGAVRVEQCKCLSGLVRRGGVCVADNPLYEFVAGAVCADACSVPGNASLVAVRGVGGKACEWECNVGFYRHTLSGQCLACRGGRALTRGDDDSPLSCEPA